MRVFEWGTFCWLLCKADVSYALQYIMNTIFSQVVLCISVDVSSDYNQVESVIKQVRCYPLLKYEIRTVCTTCNSVNVADPVTRPLLTCCRYVGSGEAGTSWHAGELRGNIHFWKVWRSRSGPFQSGYLDVTLRSILSANSNMPVPKCAFLQSKCGQTVQTAFSFFTQKLMEVNYLGSVYPTRAVITTMKERRMGRIMFVSSQAGQIGLFGYTAYSPSKFALRGLAESLQMEVSFCGLRPSVSPFKRTCWNEIDLPWPNILLYREQFLQEADVQATTSWWFLKLASVVAVVIS